MYQILREANKAKGKVIVYDRAGLPKGTTVKQVLYNATNDSFIDYSSSAAGNMGQKDLSMSNIIKEIDLGVSSSLPVLLQLKADLKRELDDITGINNAREGGAPASATVANNQQNLESSRTITEPLYYYMTKYAENVMLNIVETGKLSWALYKPNKARLILGDEKYNFLKLTQEVAFARYKVQLVNPRWEQSINERMRQYAELSLNAKELRVVDMMDYELQETMADKRATLRNAWEQIEKSRGDQAQQGNQASMQQAQQQQEAMAAAAKEDREDRQAHDLEKIHAQALADIMVNTNGAKNDYINNNANNQHQAEQNQMPV